MRRAISDKVQLASYKVFEIVTKKIQSHTISEVVIFLTCREIVNCMLSENVEKEISSFP